MKKLLLIVCLLISSAAICQTRIETYKNKVGDWNEYTKKWDYNDVKYADITFTLNGSILSADNVANARYRISDDMEKETTEDHSYVIFFDCKDKKGRTCIVVFADYTDNPHKAILIMYDDTLFKYFITPKTSTGLSPFRD